MYFLADSVRQSSFLFSSNLGRRTHADLHMHSYTWHHCFSHRSYCSLPTMGLPPPLVESFKWAKKCVEWCVQHAKSDLLTRGEIQASTWFSGYGCAEQAFCMLNQALQAHNGTSLVSPSYQYEINAKARGCSQTHLPRHTCQHIDIMRVLCEEDRKELLHLEKSSSDPGNDLWTFIIEREFADGDLCAKHRQRQLVLFSACKTNRRK